MKRRVANNDNDDDNDDVDDNDEDNDINDRDMMCFSSLSSFLSLSLCIRVCLFCVNSYRTHECVCLVVYVCLCGRVMKRFFYLFHVCVFHSTSTRIVVMLS